MRLTEKVLFMENKTDRVAAIISLSELRFFTEDIKTMVDDENVKAIGAILNKALSDIGENKIQIFLFLKMKYIDLNKRRIGQLKFVNM